MGNNLSQWGFFARLSRGDNKKQTDSILSDLFNFSTLTGKKEVTMIRQHVAILLALAVSIASFSPALADDASPKVSTAPSVSGSSGGTSLGVRLIAFSIGFLVGTPIAMARKTGDETISGLKDIVGESRNPLLVIPFGALSAVPGAISGIFQGPFYAAKNSWTNSDDAPFSKESFSLGDMD